MPKDELTDCECGAPAGQSCQCEGEDITGCPFHTVGHPYQSGCCDQDEDIHRHPTRDEYEAMYPLVFDETVTVDDVHYSVDARRYPFGVGMTLTRLFAGDGPDDEPAGLCFDIPLRHLRVVLPVLQDASAHIIEE